MQLGELRQISDGKTTRLLTGRGTLLTRNSDLLTQERDLAANIGIKFLTPEEYFQGAEAAAYERPFDPRQYLDSLRPSSEAGEAVAAPFTKNHPQELVVFCGSPGSGKSTFFWTVLQPLGYERVNQDILKTVSYVPDLPDTGNSSSLSTTS
jgi:bifunctional polynucleotide phosphatase/kinase